MKALPTPLRTVWGERLAELPVSSYPRPMLRREEWRCLNGAWSYAIITGGAHEGQAETERSISEWDGTILVPFAVETDASGVARALGPDDLLVYERSIEIPEQWRGRRIALNFEAVDYRCTIWADGVLIGAHRGGYLPFSVELPSTAAPAVRIRVEVVDPTDAGSQQRGKQSLKPQTIWYPPVSGIWQSVWMEPLPRVALTRIAARTREDLRSIDLLISAERPGVPARITIENPDGDDLHAETLTGVPTTLRIPFARPWTPEDPAMYRVRVSTDEDEARSWIGLRTVSLSPQADRRSEDAPPRPCILLNGEPFLLNAPLYQPYWPESGLTPPDEEALRFDIEQMRAMGFTGMRVHISIAPRRFYHLADRLGLVLVQDAVSGGRAPLGIRMSGAIQALDATAPDGSGLFAKWTGRSDPASKEEFLRDWVDTIHHLEAHPSIICWVPFNEGWGQFDARSAEALTRRTDPTRLIDAASGWFDQGGGDFRSRHRYVLRLIPPPRRDARPFYLSEFGGLNLAVPGHMRRAGAEYGYTFTEDAEALANALSSLYRDQLIPLVDKGLAAASYTQACDVEQETNGLMTYDRRVVKVDAALLAGLNAELEREFTRVHCGRTIPA